MLVTLSIKGNIMLRFLALILLTSLTLGAFALQAALAVLSVMGAGAAFLVVIIAEGIERIISKFSGA